MKCLFSQCDKKIEVSAFDVHLKTVHSSDVWESYKGYVPIKNVFGYSRLWFITTYPKNFTSMGQTNYVFLYNSDRKNKTTNFLNVKSEHFNSASTIQVCKIMVENIPMYFVFENTGSKFYGYVLAHLPLHVCKKFVCHITICSGSRVSPISYIWVQYLWFIGTYSKHAIVITFFLFYISFRRTLLNKRTTLFHQLFLWGIKSRHVAWKSVLKSWNRLFLLENYNILCLLDDMLK